MTKLAIQKAIEGGFSIGIKLDDPDFEWYLHHVKTNDILLNPSFWQALGKALGWESECEYSKGEQWSTGKHCFVFVKGTRHTHKKCCHCEIEQTDNNTKHWKDKWHRFIDHLAEGKDAESFFKELLK